MALKFRGSICLSNIPESRMYERNGKWYVDVIIGDQKEPSLDKNGNVWSDHYIKCNLKKDEAAPVGVNLYIGNLKEQNGARAVSEAGLPWMKQQQETKNDNDLDSLF